MKIQYDDEEDSLILGEPIAMGEPVTPEGTPVDSKNDQLHTPFDSEDVQYQKFKHHNRLTLVDEPVKEIVHKVVYGDTL